MATTTPFPADSEDTTRRAFVLTWRFPATKAVMERSSFVVQRVTREPLPAQLFLAVEDEPPGQLQLEGQALSSFEVEEEPAGFKGSPGVLLVRLTRRLLVDGEEPSLLSPSLQVNLDDAAEWERITTAAEVWTTCFAISDQPVRELLRQVLGVPVFDGLIATRLLGQARPYMEEVARLALADCKNDTLARQPDAPDFLGHALRKALENHLSARLLPDPLIFDPLALEEGITAWGARLARYLEGLGQAQLARHLRSKGQEPGTFWLMWVPSADSPPLYRLTYAALALWRTKVRALFEQMRRNPPAIVMAVHEPVTRLLSRTHKREEIDGQKFLTQAGDVLAMVSAMDADTLSAIFIDHGIEMFNSVTAHRVLRWQIQTAHHQAIEGHPDPRVLLIDGGYSALAHDVLGMKSKRAAEEIRNIIEAEHACEIPLPPRGDFSRLLIRRNLPTAGRQRARLELVLGTALLPNYVYELQAAFGHSLERARATRLVPMLELPPFLGRDNEHGAQATLSMLVVSYMRDHARELPPCQ